MIGRVLTRSQALAGIAAATLAVRVFAQQDGVVPLPAAEVFVQQEGLTVQLRLPNGTLHTGADPGFTLRFENRGARTLYINPRVESNLFITTPEGRPVPAVSSIAERVLLSVRPSQLIRLNRGSSWESRVIARHYDQDLSAGNRYAEHGFTKESGWAPPAAR